MAEFLRTFRDGKLVTLADAIHTPYMMNDVRDTFSGEALWLWDQETGETQLDKLITDYEIVAASNCFAGQDTFSSVSSYPACMRTWRETALYTHIPLATLKEQEPGLRQWLSCLDMIRTENSIKDYQRRRDFLKTLTEQATEIRAFLSGREKLFASAFASYLSGLRSRESMLSFPILRLETTGRLLRDTFKNTRGTSEPPKRRTSCGRNGKKRPALTTR